MEIRSTRSIGFCQGVQRAVELAEATLRERAGRVYSIGPIIHNPPEMDRLTRLGLKVVKKIEEVPPKSWLIIRSHGATPEELGAARKRSVQVVDTTCTIVKRLQASFRGLVQEGYTVYIIGDRDHPEVQSVLSQKEGFGQVIGNVTDFERLTIPERVGVVAQTTQSIRKFESVVTSLLGRTQEVKCINTLCPVTLGRQREAIDLAEHVGTMLVIGGKNSANTNRLTELCREANPNTHQVERTDEICADWTSGGGVVGLTTGTSTPGWLIEGIIARLREGGCPDGSGAT